MSRLLQFSLAIGVSVHLAGQTTDDARLAELYERDAWFELRDAIEGKARLRRRSTVSTRPSSNSPGPSVKPRPPKVPTKPEASCRFSTFVTANWQKLAASSTRS